MLHIVSAPIGNVFLHLFYFGWNWQHYDHGNVFNFFLQSWHLSPFLFFFDFTVFEVCVVGKVLYRVSATVHLIPFLSDYGDLFWFLSSILCH